MEKEADGARQRINVVASAVEGLGAPAKKRIESAAKSIATSADTALTGMETVLGEVKRASVAALEKLNLKSFDELGQIKSQIAALKQEAVELN